MAYVKQTWTDLPDETTPITTDRLTHIEDGIYDASLQIEDLSTQIGDLSTLNTTDKTSLVNASNELNNILESLKDELFYKAGDTLVLPSGYAIVTGGHLTNGITEITFNIYTPKSMKNITSISVSGATMACRQNGNYIIGSGSAMASVSLVATKMTDNSIRLVYTSSKELTSGTNNDVIAIALGTATFTFS